LTLHYPTPYLVVEVAHALRPMGSDL